MNDPVSFRSLHGVLIKVAYDGTAFHGWAAQRDTRTVQGVLSAAIQAIDPNASAVRGTSRTDAGVHAEGQMVAFDSTLKIPDKAWVHAINQHLPDDVAVREARSVPAQFNPRFASRGKRYGYRLLLDHLRQPLLRERAWRVHPSLDLEAVAVESRFMIGTHDFASFRTASDPRENTVRTVTKIEIVRGRDSADVRVVVEGTAFMHNMVRIMVGTLVEVGLSRRPQGTVQRALMGRDRQLTGITAPAHGLTLESIDLELPEEAGEPWPR